MLGYYNETGARCGICLFSCLESFFLFLKIYGRMHRYYIKEKVIFLLHFLKGYCIITITQ